MPCPLAIDLARSRARDGVNAPDTAAIPASTNPRTPRRTSSSMLVLRIGCGPRIPFGCAGPGGLQSAPLPARICSRATRSRGAMSTKKQVRAKLQEMIDRLDQAGEEAQANLARALTSPRTIQIDVTDLEVSYRT